MARDYNKVVGRNASPKHNDWVRVLESSSLELASQRDKHDQNGKRCSPNVALVVIKLVITVGKVAASL